MRLPTFTSLPHGNFLLPLFRNLQSTQNEKKSSKFSGNFLTLNFWYHVKLSKKHHRVSFYKKMYVRNLIHTKKKRKKEKKERTLIIPGE